MQTHFLLERLPLQSTADVQDSLMVAAHDLDRLQRLLGDATSTLMTHFYDASSQLQSLRQAQSQVQNQTDPHSRSSQAQAQAPELYSQTISAAITHMAGAVTALQFEDMAAQLIAHTTRRLRHCADRLTCDAMADGSEGDAYDFADGPAYLKAPPLRSNPVTQDEVGAGSIELF